MESYDLMLGRVAQDSNQAIQIGNNMKHLTSSAVYVTKVMA